MSKRRIERVKKPKQWSAKWRIALFLTIAVLITDQVLNVYAHAWRATLWIGIGVIFGFVIAHWIWNRVHESDEADEANELETES